MSVFKISKLQKYLRGKTNFLLVYVFGLKVEHLNKL